VTERPKSQESPTGFQVRDRRRFDASGEVREPTGPDAEAAPGEPASGEASAAASQRRDAAAAESRADDVPVTFSTFVLGLSTQALLHLGEIPNPATGAVERDLPAAKHVIDILGVLDAKTRGNLDEAEQSLLESVLYDLRIQYVDIVRRQPKEQS
jgi:hypothetical protein